MGAITVSGIWIYPVKSLGGIALDSADVMYKGLKYDRRWMLIDSNNKFMTQREYPHMALFRMQMEGEGFSVCYKNECRHFGSEFESSPISAMIWHDTVEVFEVNRDLSKWFSEMLGSDCRLVGFPEQNERPVDRNYAFDNEQVSLADAYPLLIIGQNSLDDLNERMNMPLPMNRFRPNIAFEGQQPFEEDEWKDFTIGNCQFTAVKPCARCTIPTVDQATAAKGKEPLATLSTYRQRNNKIYFGQNLLVKRTGTIRVGDAIVLM